MELELANGTALRTIIFRNVATSEVCAIICVDAEALTQQQQRLESLPHIEVINSGFSVVKGKAYK